MKKQIKSLKTIGNSILVISEEVKVKTATRSLIKGVTVGITADKRLVIFMGKDYDNKGNIEGPFEDVTKIMGTDGYYLLSNTYTEESMQKLSFKEADQKTLLNIAKSFAKKNK